MPDFSPLAPIATVLASFVAAAAAIYGARKNFESSRKLSQENEKTQLLLRTIDNDFKNRERTELRVQNLRNEHVSPFFAELTHNFGLAGDVQLHIETLKKQCPLSADFKRQLLFNAGVVVAWGDSGVALSDHRAKVLLVLNKTHVNDFLKILNDLVRLQIKIVQYLEESFDFTEEASKKFEAEYEKYETLSSELFIFTRNAIYSSLVADDKIDWSIKGLSHAIFADIPAKLKFQCANRASSWSVWWRITRPSDAGSTAAYESFCSERDKFQKVVVDLEGVLETHPESADNSTEHQSRLTIQFASERSLEKFLGMLPELKIQTKPLWIVSASPQELIIRSPPSLSRGSEYSPDAQSLSPIANKT